MPLNAAPATLTAPGRARRCGLARWWLAGLLVSCLLPVGLSPASAASRGERAVLVCLWVPAILRAQSRRIAIKRRVRHLVCRVKTPAVRFCKRLWDTSFITLYKVAAQDVLTQRGPPHQ
ncbi:hypothetical protein [Vreelandella sp. EE7]